MNSMFFEYLRDDPEQAGPCPGEEPLCGYVEQSLVDVEIHWLESHLAQCRACRKLLVLAGAMPVPARAASVVPASPAGRVRVVLGEAMKGIRILAEGFIDLAAFDRPLVPVFRSSAEAPAPERCEREIALGPYRLRVPVDSKGGDGACRLQLIGASGSPVASVRFEVELLNGRLVPGQTDVDGWMDLAGLNLSSMVTIWLAMH